jgi:hypothetical protein
MIKIPSISALCLSLATIATGLLSMPMSALADDFSRSENADESIRSIGVRGQSNNEIKPVLPQVKRSGTADDSVRPVLPKLNRSGADDSIRPILPKVQKSGTDDDSLRKILRQGQGDESI